MKLTFEEIHLPLGKSPLVLDCALEGRLIAIFGASGAGKTSLLELIAGLRRASGGRLSLEGRVLSDGPFHLAARHRRIGYVPQDLALFPHLHVRANVCYGAPEADEKKLSSVCEVLEIASLLERMPASLSGGEKQRVAFARAVLAEPALLLLDEPLSSLDQTLKQRILPYLQRIRDEIGIPMLYVTHSADEVMRLCDQMLVLKAGRAVAQGPPAELLEASSEIHYRLK